MKRVKNDLTGKRFGKLTVIGISNDDRKTKWVCQCDCGGIKSVRADALLRGATKSCGCIRKESSMKNLSIVPKHNMSNTRLYKIWSSMKKRCNNVNSVSYHNYGGRGIKVCKEWNDFMNFYEWSMGNGYNDSLSIDRIDNDGNYEPNNCRWADRKTQSNNRRSNIKITIGKSTKTLKQWCEIFNLNYQTIIERYHSFGFQSVDQLFNANTEVISRPLTL